MIQKFVRCLILTIVLLSCNKKNEQRKPYISGFQKGSFGYDLQWLNQYSDPIILKSENNLAQVLLSPEYQGRVMTSTAAGPEGYSFGWLNHKLIASGEKMEHFNPIGGEERFWLGPEGGQFSIFFKSNTLFEFENWYVPAEIDTEPFRVVSANDKEASFEREMQLVNYSNTIFDLRVNRTVRLLDQGRIESNLGIQMSDSVVWVGFESENVLTNTGSNAWTRSSGMLSVWILSMLNPSDSTVVIIPFKTGDEEKLGPVVTDDYFGKVPAGRLSVKDGLVFFKADGKKRSKIGISPRRALPLAGSYDPITGVLTIAQFSLPANNFTYVNSLWKLQDDPFKGDAVNSYNDGPLEDGSQLGPFYELESSSPAASLQPNEQLTHIHRTYHFIGSTETLDPLVKTVFGIGIEEILKAL